MTFTTFVTGLRTSVSSDAAAHQPPAAANDSPHTPAPTPTAQSGDPLARLMAAQGFHPDVPKSTQSLPPNSGQPSASPRQLPPDEVAYRATHGEEGLRLYQELKAKRAEVEQAHKIYQATGTIPHTKTPFSWIEIKEGRLMSRTERYDAMLKAQGKAQASGEDLAADRRNPEYLTKEEFHAEFHSRLLRIDQFKVVQPRDRSGWDIALGVLDTATDYALPMKAAAKAAISGNYEDAFVLATMAIPGSPDAKLGLWDAEKDMAAGAAKQAVKSTIGPLAETAERVNELRKGNWQGAFPEVAAVVNAPGDLYNGARKIAEGDVRGGVRQAAPAVLTLAGIIEGFAAAGKPGPATAAPTGGPKQLPPGSSPKQLPPGSAAHEVQLNPASRSESASGAAANAGESGTNNAGSAGNQRPALEPTAVDVSQEQAREAAAQRAAEARAKFERTTGSTMPAEGESISVESAIDGMRRLDWPAVGNFDAATHQSAWHATGGQGRAPVAFRRGTNIYVDMRRLTPAQERRFERAQLEFARSHVRQPPIGDSSVDPGGGTQQPVHNTHGRGALDKTDPRGTPPSGNPKP